MGSGVNSPRLWADVPARHRITDEFVATVHAVRWKGFRLRTPTELVRLQDRYAGTVPQCAAAHPFWVHADSCWAPPDADSRDIKWAHWGDQGRYLAPQEVRLFGRCPERTWGGAFCPQHGGPRRRYVRPARFGPEDAWVNAWWTAHLPAVEVRAP